MERLSAYLAGQKAAVDEALDRYLPPMDREPRRLHECMRYAVAEGKRLRPILTLAVADMLGCPAERALPTAAAIELIHTHSLVLDDLPCMDNDDSRRGRPACHRRFGESTALLAADAVLNLAIAILGANHRLGGVPAETALDIIREVGESVGTAGVIGGQAADLAFDRPTGKTLEMIHRRKTGRLFRLSARAGARIAGAAEEQLAAVSAYGEGLGLAFQIIDDVMDEATAVLSADRRQAEPSYAASYGPDVARHQAAMISEGAIQELSGFGPAADRLRQLAEHNLARTD